jgi:Protein of unknown function (DUF2892)
MTRNVGRLDQVVRVIIGLAILSLAFFGPKTPFGFLGIIPLVTVLVGFCPLYTVLGISTCERRPGTTH